MSPVRGCNTDRGISLLVQPNIPPFWEQFPRGTIPPSLSVVRWWYVVSLTLSLLPESCVSKRGWLAGALSHPGPGVWTPVWA